MLWLCLAPLLLLGCASPGPRIAREPYSGPAVEVDSKGLHHTIVMTTPTAGWSIALDQTIRRFDETEVYVSISRPDPAYMHAQASTATHLDSTIDSSRKVRVFARTLEFGKRVQDRAYQAVEPVGAGR